MFHQDKSQGVREMIAGFVKIELITRTFILCTINNFNPILQKEEQ